MQQFRPRSELTEHWTLSGPITFDTQIPDVVIENLNFETNKQTIKRTCKITQNAELKSPFIF